MRRAFVLILLLCIGLTGCTTTAEDEALIYGSSLTEEALYEWNTFFWYSSQDGPAQIRLDDYGREGAVLRLENGVYTITDADGSRSYPYLLTEQARKDTNDTVCTAFVLSDQEYLDTAANRENVFTVTVPFEPAAQFGDLPKVISKQTQNFSRNGLLFRKLSYFCLTGMLADDSSPDGLYHWERYNYKGSLLCDFTTYSNIRNLLELEDGSFLLETELENVTYLICHDKDGRIQWKTAVGEYLYAQALLQFDGKYYLFCEYHPENADSDILVYCIDETGTILQQACYGGSDFDSIDYVDTAESGFVLFGSTQSRDGDFPFSSDGYGVSFSAEISADLTLRNAAEDTAGRSIDQRSLGTCQGLPIYSGDPILEPTVQDMLPQYCYAEGIFEFDDGYVIVRRYPLARYVFAPPFVSYLPSYWQAVITGYSGNGQPLWQTVSNVYVA